MKRYRTEGALDDPPMVSGDGGFVGVNEYDAAENLQPGQVQAAVNMDFTTQDAVTRGGFVCLPSLSMAPLALTWTSRTSAADKAWRGSCYGNNTFVAVGDSGGIMTSTDGVTWTQRTDPSPSSFNWRSVAYGAGIFVAVDNGIGVANQIMRSVDGITWTLGTSPDTIPGTFWTGIIYAGNQFVAVGYSGVSTSRIITSPDGINWTERTSALTSNALSAITYGNGVYVVTSSTSGTLNIQYSSNGITWTAITSAISGGAAQWYSVTFGADLFVAVGGSGAVATSPDGITWTSQTAAEANTWQSVTYGRGLFVAVSSGGTNRSMVSRDGVTWSASAAAAANQWFSVCYGAGQFAAFSNSGTGNRVMTNGDSTRTWASGIYSDPDDAGSQWIMLVGALDVTFVAYGRQSRTVSLGGYSVSAQSTVVQCNNQVYIFRGADSVPLYWTGDWSTTFTIAPTTTPATGFSIIPNSNQATYYQNRLWVVNGKDTVAASDILDFTAYDDLASSFNVNTGSSDYLVATYPFGENSLVVFKNRSILLLQNVQGGLNDVTVTEITRQVGLVGINAVVSVGADLVYMSDRNINLLTQTATNNAVQHKTLPLSRNIRKIFSRVNWQQASKVSMAYNDNKLYVALPLDNSTVCNSVVVYNFVTENWYGEWTFDAIMQMAIQGWAVVNYLGLQRLHAISEDGRIFVAEEGQNDISGTTVAEISTSLTTRAYTFDLDNTYQRRLWLDLATNRPSFSVTSYSEGVSESSSVLSAQTYSRTDSWLFNDSTYTATNANDDFNRAYRKDYSTGPNSIQCGTGFMPEMEQEYRFPIITRRQGRLSWLKIDNTQGLIRVQSAGFENRAGARNNLVQV